VDSPKCPACPHFARQHNLDGDRKCRVHSLSGWSDEKQQYLRSTPCGCPGFPAGLETAADHCACEFVPASNHCVHCGKVKV
jgi:hypothetical protein